MPLPNDIRTPLPPALEQLLTSAIEARADWAHAVRDDEEGNGAQQDEQDAEAMYRYHLDKLREFLGELVADAARLDALECEAMIEPLALHDGRQEHIGGLRGLGLMPGSLRRTLREAVDQAFRRARVGKK